MLGLKQTSSDNHLVRIFSQTFTVALSMIVYRYPRENAFTFSGMRKRLKICDKLIRSLHVVQD